MTTHYETLGVSEAATQDEIKKAYRALASKHHPDKGGNTATFQSIQSAYDIISDTDKRQQYDVERSQGPNEFQFNHAHGQNINDLFRSFGFGGTDPFGQFRQQAARRNKDLKIELNLPLNLTLTDHIKTISVQTTNGHRETVEVKIPRGITNGTSIKYNGLGDNLFNTISRGDLYVQINVHNVVNFIPNGIDLYTNTSVNCFKAIAGGTVNIPALDDRIFELTIPAGSQPGTKFRIAGQGLYQLHSDNRGDLYVEMAVTIPQDLTTEQLEIVRTLTTD
jgi:DnaJ-class molecular chaperone